MNNICKVLFCGVICCYCYWGLCVIKEDIVVEKENIWDAVRKVKRKGYEVGG